MKGLLFLFALVFGIAVTNFTAGTYLTGWDNLHPEFNFPLNIYRSLFASWQEYQGLGLAGGTGYASDLPRQIFLWLLSFVFPNNMLRYMYHFLMLFVGALGVYTLLKNYILTRFDLTLRERASLVGGILYIFNLGTVQMFYLPFEAYSHHFAALPWLVYTFLRFLDRGDKKSLLYLFLVNVLAIPQGYVATYFLVTTIVILIILFINFLKTKQLQRTCIALSVLFITNAFWLLPNLYFLVYKVNIPVVAKINQMSTEDNFLKNKKFGDLADSALLKGFWFDNVDRNSDGSMTYQMRDWILHLQNRFIVCVGYLLFALSILGIIIGWRKKLFEALLFLPVFLLSFTILANDTPVFSQVSTVFYSLPLFSQIFRFPFTKFAIIVALTLSIFYAVSFLTLIQVLKQKIAQAIIFSLFLVLPLIFVYPVFLGKLFDTRNEVKIPQEYFAVFDFFAKQEKDSRIANLPQYTFWGWSFYNWGYRGSGILWYGIEQPILDRAFDVWSKENENYYHEISYAIYAGNQKLFESILEKYQIRWILVDDNIISYSSQKQILFTKLKDIVYTSPKVKLAANYGNIHIYAVTLRSTPKHFVTVVENLPSVLPTYTWNNYDSAYVKEGNYVNPPTALSQLDNFTYYPFRSLFTARIQDELEFTAEDKGDYFSFSTIIPKDLVGSFLVFPEVFQEEIEEVDKNKLDQSIVRYPQVFLDGELILNQITPNQEGDLSKDSTNSSKAFLPYIRKGKLEVRVPKIKGYYSYTNNTDTLLSTTPRICNPFNAGSFERKKVSGGIQLTSISSSNCIDIDLPNFSHRLGYLITVGSTYKEGKSLLLTVSNTNSDHADLETYLPKVNYKITSYFVLPPLEKYTIGYGLHFDNISIGRVKTQNELGKVTVNTIPYSFLTSLKIVKNNTSFDLKPTHDLTNATLVEHPYPYLYTVKLPKVSSQVYVLLSQSFDSGWETYEILNTKYQILNTLKNTFPFLFGTKLKKHVLVNNWSNGWILPSTFHSQPYTLVILYLPQYLQYIGFILLGTTLIWTLKRN